MHLLNLTSTRTPNRYVNKSIWLAQSDQCICVNKAYFKMQNVLVDDRRIWVDLYDRHYSHVNIKLIT